VNYARFLLPGSHPLTAGYDLFSTAGFELLARVLHHAFQGTRARASDAHHPDWLGSPQISRETTRTRERALDEVDHVLGPVTMSVIIFRLCANRMIVYGRSMSTSVVSGR